MIYCWEHAQAWPAEEVGLNAEGFRGVLQEVVAFPCTDLNFPWRPCGIYPGLPKSLIKE